MPLAASGSEGEIWFVGDLDPSIIEFDASRELDYAICRRVNENTFEVVKRLHHRPVDLLMSDGTLWFVSEGEDGFSVYALNLATTGSTQNPYSKMQWTISGEFHPVDMIEYQGGVLVCSAADCLTAIYEVNGMIRELPSLCDQAGARVANCQGKIFAGVPDKEGFSLWELGEKNWLGGENYELEGDFEHLLAKDDWLLVVSSDSEYVYLIGVNEGASHSIASFQKPSGRWSIEPSPLGLTLLSVERNGTVIAKDLSWPSGMVYQSSLLHPQFLSTSQTFFNRFPFFIPATLTALVFLILARRSGAKTTKK